MQYKLSGLALAALAFNGAVAAPSVHRRHAHQRRSAQPDGDWAKDVDWSTVDYSNVDWSTVNYGGSATAAAASVASAIPTSMAVSAAVAGVTAAANMAISAPSSAAATAAPSMSASGSVNMGDSSSNGPFLSDCFGAESSGQGGSLWNIVGNIGSPAGSNMAQVQDATQYQYTNSFVNKMDSTRTIYLWNKAGWLNGAIQASAGQGAAQPDHQFQLAPGQTTTWAFMNNTQAVACDYTDNAPRGAGNAFNCAWVEMNFVQGFSAFDVSRIIQNQAGSSQCNVQVQAAGQGSDKTSSCTEYVFNSQSDSDTIARAVNSEQVNLVTTFGSS